ncbi:hypothetical protein [Caballeronia cordobensis]|uniref:hypothetical protein n=1 Tax=Caballeronia cordobensis TaxID=1353886 RepID=UPI0006AD6461|nr:hypothetical protein [Caballeronia cordobensis]
MDHRGASFEPSVTREGNTFIARAVVLTEAGDLASLGALGVFANEESAFPVRCATAFIDGDELPLPPNKIKIAAPQK